MGAAVLVALLAVAWLLSRGDGAIDAPGEVASALIDRGGVPLPVRGPTPCEGPTLTASAAVADPAFAGSTVLVCGHDALGSIGFRVDRELPFAARPTFRIEGNVLAGGPLAVRQGILLHRDDAGVAWTTSRKAAGRVSRRPVPSVLVFGHTRWGPGQLNREIDAGAWTVDDRATLPGDS